MNCETGFLHSFGLRWAPGVYEDPRGARHWVHFRVTDLYAVGSVNLNPAVGFGSPAGFCRLHNHGESSGLSKAPRRVELTALQIALEGFAEDAIPALHRVQLLRSLPQLRQEAGDPQVSSPCFVLFASGR